MSVGATFCGVHTCNVESKGPPSTRLKGARGREGTTEVIMAQDTFIVAL